MVFRQDGFRFFFYSNEGDPLEPFYIHVQKAGAGPKFWLSSADVLERSEGFYAKTLRKLSKIVEGNRSIIEDKRNEYFS